MSQSLPQKPPSETTVVVGMSGGVDSSVVAALLKEQGYQVIGMFMKNWEEKDANGVCQSSKEFADVVKVCEKLDIPYYSVEFIKEYWDTVFTRFLKEYQEGFTPNPDILCNREIKFNVFLKKALDLGADFLATGHYCRNLNSTLVKGLDPGKDQSYFLYTVTNQILEKVLFPIGHLQKSEVREIARKYGLATAGKKDSTGICFIGEKNFKPFLSQYLAIKPGDFRTLDGVTVGRHSGAAFYTLGQRKGLGLGGEGEAWYVVKKDPSANVVFVERGDRHPALYTDDLEATEVSWVGERPPLLFRCQAKVRYRQADQDCTITGFDGDRLKVTFDQPQRAVTCGQSVVFYSGDTCLGGAVIRSTGSTYHELGKALPQSSALLDLQA
ncbi:MAG: tRNA 2-thiouridine(34) synthase MnmA [Methylotenera sp.]|nr:tRNA 2-thiouridine(34) synthase MnmA [Oligoflexia bacterium]